MTIVDLSDVAKRSRTLPWMSTPWDLDILVKELVLNAGSGGDRSLRRWNDLVLLRALLSGMADAVRRNDGSAGDRYL